LCPPLHSIRTQPNTISGEYEWDEAKRKANLKKHRLDFAVAYLVYESPDKVTYRIRELPKERFLDIALVRLNGAVLALVYIIRNGNVRCISFG